MFLSFVSQELQKLEREIPVKSSVLFMFCRNQNFILLSSLDRG